MTRITKHSALQLLLTLTLASASLTHDCSDNCSFCYGNNLCRSCYQRKLITAPKGVYQICSSTPLPASDPCLIYRDGGDCLRCKPGYAVVHNGGSLGQCIRGSIQNCLYQVYFKGQMLCYSCLGGYPSSDESSCIPTNQVRNPIAQCTVGQIDVGNNQLLCEQCSPGYTSSLYKCFPTPASLRGCLRSSSGRCQECDAANGYFMREAYTCAKNDSASA